LLSKLAVLELCGWIEGEFDRLAMLAEKKSLNDSDWVQRNVTANTSGFKYLEHWRPMLTKLVGESIARRIEKRLYDSSPADMEQLKSLLGTLWTLRCAFAHGDLVANQQAAQVFNAPTWTINQHRIIKKIIDRYEQAMLAELAAIWQ
jgi:hypothetical protein